MQITYMNSTIKVFQHQTQNRIHDTDKSDNKGSI